MYAARPPKHRSAKRALIVIGILVVILVSAVVAVRLVYNQGLKPVNTANQTAQLITIESGSSLDQIATQLHKAGLIRNVWAFKLYVGSKEVREDLEAGTYAFNPSMNVPQVVAQLTHGKVATDLVTILPGQTLAQISNTLVNYGFANSDVQAALNPALYAGHPALVDKPAGASLEGYIYPDSYQKTANTKPEIIVSAALDEMNKALTPDLRAAFAQQGLSTYQGIILASIVEKEVAKQSDRDQVAQVLIKRYKSGMTLGSDVTAYYGALLAGQPASTAYDSPYNTHLHTGLPPTPISNVSASSLHAVAHPATTDWLYFVTGDDGTTHFSHTLDEHNAAVQQYCHKLCGEN